jgi:hypothetical protein
MSRVLVLRIGEPLTLADWHHQRSVRLKRVRRRTKCARRSCFLPIVRYLYKDAVRIVTVAEPLSNVADDGKRNRDGRGNEPYPGIAEALIKSRPDLLLRRRHGAGRWCWRCCRRGSAMPGGVRYSNSSNRRSSATGLDEDTPAETSGRPATCSIHWPASSTS